MKEFIDKLVLFILPFVQFGLLFPIYSFYQQTKVDKKLHEISQNTCFLIGDSQIQRINKKYFKMPTYNFASYGEGYFFSYNKLLKITKN